MLSASLIQKASPFQYTVRTDGWRYTAWARWNVSSLRGDLDGDLVAEELYDHRENTWGAVANYSEFENENLAGRSELQPVKEQLRARLQAMFGGAADGDAALRQEPDVAACQQPSANATATCLQAAFDAAQPGETVSLPFTGSPWVVSGPLYIRRDGVTLHLLPGVVLEAERGQFHGISDCLLTVGGGSEPVSGVTVRGSPGAVLRMHREDYANAALYTKAEVG